MRTITGLYNTYDEAKVAVDALEDAGVSSSDISIVGPDGSDNETLLSIAKARRLLGYAPQQGWRGA